ncbi:MAG: HAMP domain-containing protein [Planctomycetes bacterium]|nr:HAMP domain-containing protein [Planctomycetota bacterium]
MTDQDPRARRGASLVLRLVLGLGLFGAALWAAYTGYEIATGRAAFQTNTDRILEDAGRNLGQVTDELIGTTEVFRDTLVDSILRAGEDQLADEPLSLYPDETAVRRAILARWKARFEMKRAAAREVDRVIRARVRDEVDRRMAEMNRARREQAARLVDAATWRSLGSAALVAVALIVGFSLALYLTVIRPVRALTSAAHGIEQGELDRRVALDRKDEFGVLAAAFNNMVASVQHALGEVAALNAELEQRVADKTEALARTVAETREANARLERALADLKAAQGRLVQAEKMSAIGALAGGVAHEFNNLLGGILGSAEAALEEQDLGPRSREAVAMIHRTAGRAARITENLLRFARPGDPDRAPAPLGALVADALKLVEAEARKRGVVIRLEAAELGTGAAVAGELHQVVLNLLVNAVQASPPGGTVMVELFREGDVLGIAVVDEGEGIPEALRDKVFDPFFTTKGPDGGTGLGLSVSYGIVERNRGTLEFAPGPRGGTRFVVRVPAAPAAPA